ncbi:MAG TPA: RtcB family protein [Chloroflexia bacterium]|nr:RtcB family protein [Chloroflexia bacterium]
MTNRPIYTYNWKDYAIANPAGYFDLATADTGAVPVRLFFTPALLAAAEDGLYPQIVTATRFPGVKLVAITPDAHFGYGVPVGSVILTDSTVAMGPVGYDIGCGMISARSAVPVDAATPAQRLAFNQAVMARVEMGAGGLSKTALRNVGEKEFEKLVRGGADYYIAKYGARVDRSRAERNRIPVDDPWVIPWGGKGRPERGISQLGSLGGGNHFIELQRCEETGTLFVQVHSGSRGFGHGLATNYFELARAENPRLPHLDQGYFTPDSVHYRSYLNAVAAGGNFAIINRLILFQQLAEAFRTVFGADLELIYEISHNLVQREWHPDYGDVWVHRKGATRAFPAGHPGLAGTIWADQGHPILIPGSNRDYSFILRPLPGAVRSGYSVNHGAGRRLSRSAAKRELDQERVNQLYRADGIVVNADSDVPLDESDACYKSAAAVVDAVVGAGLAEIEYRLWPLASLKGLN